MTVFEWRLPKVREYSRETLPGRPSPDYGAKVVVKLVLWPAGSLGWISRELQVGQAHVVDHDLIGADIYGRLKIRNTTGAARSAGGIHCSRSDEVIFIDAVSANAQAADQNAILIEGQAAGEKDDSAHVVCVRGAAFRSLRARVGDVVKI